MVACTGNPSTREAEVRGPHAEGQPVQDLSHSKIKQQGVGTWLSGSVIRLTCSRP